MILRITALEVCGPTTLQVEFNDGSARQVDLFPILEGPVLEGLRNPESFARIFLNPTTGTVEWPNGVDLAPEAIQALPDGLAPRCWVWFGIPLPQLIRDVEAMLPGIPAAEGDHDPRWQAMLEMSDHIETNPEEIWRFVARWGSNAQEDLRDAVACCLLEHLLELHFELIFPRVDQLAREDRMFADTFCRCYRLGQAESPDNAARFDALVASCSSEPRA